MTEGTVFNIQRFCTDDGGGIRTTVFFKGCPLSCVWCHNPESKNAEPEIMYSAEKCIGCGNCAAVCQNGAHAFDEDGMHVFGRAACSSCGKCAEECNSLALEICGKKMSAEHTVSEVMRDSAFFRQSGGGITISGGEPFFQPDFAFEILKLSKEAGLNTCVETCGFAREDVIRRSLPYVDTFLFDIKLLDPEKHKKYTGADNKIILDNLRMISESGTETILRCPIIPGINMNNEHFEGICRLASGMHGITSAELLPYHPMGIGKLERLGKRPVYRNTDFLSPSELYSVAEKMKKAIGKEVTVRI